MATHLTETQVESYQTRSLSPAERISISEHLKECSDCRARLKTVTAIPNAIPMEALLAPDSDINEHLSYEETNSYITGTLKPIERELLEEHLHSCPACIHQVEDLRTFRAGLALPDAAAERPKAFPHLITWLQDWNHRPKSRVLAWSASLALAACVLVIAWRFSVAVPGSSAQIANLKQDLKDARSQLAATKEAQQTAVQAKDAAIHDLEQKYATLNQGNAATNRLNTEITDRLKQTEKQLLAAQAQRVGPPQLGLYRDAQGKWIYRRDTVIDPRDQAILVAGLTEKGLHIPTDLQTLRSGGVTLGTPTSEGNRLPIYHPNNTCLVSLSPDFFWMALEQAQRYVLVLSAIHHEETFTITLINQETHWHVTVEADNGKVFLNQDVPVGNKWQVPVNSMLMRRGESYRWNVTAYAEAVKSENEKPLSVSSLGLFQIVDTPQQKILADAQARYAEAPLVLGIIYASYGLLDDAQVQFQMQLKQHPHDPTAQRLLAAVRKTAASH